MRLFRIAFTLFVSTGVTLAQHNMYVGVEFDVANDIYRITDGGAYLKSIPLVNPIGGINIRQEISTAFFLEAGVMLKTYQEGFGFKGIPFEGSSSSDNSVLIPVRAGWSISAYKQKLFIVPVVGYTYGINPPFGYGLGFGNARSQSLEIHYNYSEHPDVSRYFSLLQAGIGAEFRGFKGLLLSVSANRYIGINETTNLVIDYTVNNNGPFYGNAISRGQFWCIGLGAKYAISSLWKKA